MWRGGRAVECNGLENRQGFTPLVGSNPTPSVTTEAQIAITPLSPVRLPGTGRERTARARDGFVERLIHLDGSPVILLVAAAGDGALTLRAQAETQEHAERGLARLRYWTGVDVDLTEFFARFHNDPLIGRSIRSAPHWRPWRQPMPFEVLMWAICEQLITDERALGIKRQILRTHGRRHPSGLIDSPAPEAVATMSTPQLERCGLSRGRAAALITVAREIVAGRVDLDSIDDHWAATEKRLLAIREIGPWTLAVLKLHGRGDMDALPATDYGYLTLVGEVLTGRQYAKASEEQVLDLMEPYRGWRGIAGWHLLRVGSPAVAAALGRPARRS
jgi:3-methyladenine DNA glycosylase/8-oxoguanine DNA glycosylase